MTDTFEITLNSPLIDEQWDTITDVNFDKTDSIWFHTKKGKDIEFTKVIRCKDCKYWLPHSQFGFDEDNEEYHDYCGRLVPDDDYYAFTRNADDFCSRAKRNEE